MSARDEEDIEEMHRRAEQLALMEQVRVVLPEHRNETRQQLWTPPKRNPAGVMLCRSEFEWKPNPEARIWSVEVRIAIPRARTRESRV
eukprot:3806835-Rhodomonas_salina.2